MRPTEEAVAKACCADLYQSDLARLILGDNLHPGGLGLTTKLGRLMDIRRDDWVVDLASARGVSALAVSRVFHCSVVGVEFGTSAVREAQAAATSTSNVYFVRGDAESPPLRPGVFDRALCECSMSLFPDKARAVSETALLLRPRGTFGLSDVTIEPGALPQELQGDLGQVLCLTGALTFDGYVALLEDGGFAVTQTLDASGEIINILDEVEGKLGAYLAFQRMSGGVVDGTWANAGDLLTQVRGMVASGKLGYWLFVGEKRG